MYIKHPLLILNYTDSEMRYFNASYKNVLDLDTGLRHIFDNI